MIFLSRQYEKKTTCPAVWNRMNLPHPDYINEQYYVMETPKLKDGQAKLALQKG